MQVYPDRCCDLKDNEADFRLPSEQQAAALVRLVVGFRHGKENVKLALEKFAAQRSWCFSATQVHNKAAPGTRIDQCLLYII